MIGHNVGLLPALDGADVHRGAAQQRMPAAAQLRGVGRLQQLNHAGHGMHRVAAQFRPGAVRGFAPRLQPQPQGALVRGCRPQTGGLAHQRQVGPPAARHQRARPGLVVLFIHQPRKNNFRRRGTLPALRQLAERHEHGGRRAFGIAGATAKETALARHGPELLIGGAHRVQMRRQQNPLPRPAPGRKPRQHIGPPARHDLEFHIQTRPGRRHRQKISHPLLAGAPVPRRQKSRVHARQGDQLAQQSFGFRHAVSRGKSVVQLRRFPRPLSSTSPPARVGRRPRAAGGPVEAGTAGPSGRARGRGRARSPSFRA